jgi:hypothetical protein
MAAAATLRAATSAQSPKTTLRHTSDSARGILKESVP